MNTRKLIVVGGGPIGLETALRASAAGFDVTILEKGRIGAAVRSWGHVRLFTPFRMNSSSAGRAAVAADRELPEQGAILSGDDYVTSYLEPLAERIRPHVTVLEQREVVAVGRSMCGKSDLIGQSIRGAQPFRVLCRTQSEPLSTESTTDIDLPSSNGFPDQSAAPDGREEVFEADVLVDCTGFISRHRSIGAGGIPCPGESSVLSDSDYVIPDIAGNDRDQFAGQHTLVVGSGYSAATSVCLLAELQNSAPTTRVTWITRGNRSAPITLVENNVLVERSTLTATANRLAIQSDSCVEWLAGPLIERLSRTAARIRVELTWPEEDAAAEQSRAQVVVDRIIANAGFRPNTEAFHELQIHRCYATDGPINLAAHLLGETSRDCLQQSVGGPELLRNPEPNFYILGAASYGRDSRFLLQNGLKQIDALFDHIATTDQIAALEGIAT
jgi:thioredoxin reductase